MVKLRRRGMVEGAAEPAAATVVGHAAKPAAAAVVGHAAEPATGGAIKRAVVPATGKPTVPVHLKLACALIAALLAAFALSISVAPAAFPEEAHAGTGMTAVKVPTGVVYTSPGLKVKWQKISKCRIEVDDLKYTKKRQTPHVEVWSPGRVGQRLYEGFNYTVTFKNAKGKTVTSVKAPGKYRAIIKGNFAYTGKVVKTFKVVKTNYKYKVKFMNQPYSGMTNCVFVKTKNPDETSISLEFRKGGHVVKSQAVGGVRYADVPAMRKLKESSLNYFVTSSSSVHVVTDSFVKVKGGFIIPVRIDGSGKLKVTVVEHILNNKSTRIKAGKVKVRNSDSEAKKWMKQVIAQTTNDTMTKPEKMQAIANYLGSIGSYPMNYTDSSGEMHTVSLSSEAGIPYWKALRWDSYTSPSILVDFGDLIGYPMRSMYGDYPVGSAEWQAYHYFAESLDDGERYECCPPSFTGELAGVTSLDDIKAMNFLKYKHYVTAK